MKIAITTPTNWPEVRRGGERFANEFAADLTSRGHDVAVICGTPSKGVIDLSLGYRTLRWRRWWHPVLGKFGLLEFHMFFFPCFLQLVRERFDIVVSLTFMDALAALAAKPFTGCKVFLMLNGIPPQKPYFRSLSLKGSFFRRAVIYSDQVVAVSKYVGTYLENRWGRKCLALAPPVDCDQFVPNPAKSPDQIVILCAAALGDQRKGGKCLMRAFNLVKTVHPDAILQLGSPIDNHKMAELLQMVEPEYRQSVRTIAAENDLAELFSKATISVLPSLWEPYGMVVLESLAAGVPVVVTNDGALPELIASPATGRLFDPGKDSDVEASNFEGLAQAILEVILLAKDRETAKACREYALGFSWKRMGRTYEQALLAIHELKPDPVETGALQ